MANQEEIANLLNRNSCRWFAGRVCHPEPGAIVQMVRLMREVLLPNYFPGDKGKTPVDVLDDLHAILAEQIHRALFQNCYRTGGDAHTHAVADARATDMIGAMPEIQEMLYEDVVETYNGDPSASGYDEIILTYPGLLALTIYRAAHLLVGLEVPLLPRMMTEYAHRLTGIDLNPGAKIGRSIMIDHGTGIVVGETAVVGNHVKFYQGVTLGALYFPRDEQGIMVRQTKRHPTVEDYCVLYANATVLGGDTTIGHHSAIGSNAWVTESVPPYTKVLYQHDHVVRTKRI